jgi:succinate dehydrogenase hydrophobic anchor subunit
MKRDHRSPDKGLLMLSHRYTQASLSFEGCLFFLSLPFFFFFSFPYVQYFPLLLFLQALKNGDRVWAEIFQDACTKAYFHVAVGLVEMCESGSGDEEKCLHEFDMEIREGVISYSLLLLLLFFSLFVYNLSIPLLFELLPSSESLLFFSKFLTCHFFHYQRGLRKSYCYQSNGEPKWKED